MVRGMRQRNHRRSQRGMTLMEVLVSTGLLVGGGGALLVGMCHGFMSIDSLSNQQMALQAAQGKLEELAATDFDTLATGPQFEKARNAGGMKACAGEDANCNGELDIDEEIDVNGDGRADRLWPNGQLNIRIKPVPTLDKPPTEDFSDPDIMLDVSVAASWTEGRRCVGGEDANCNGQLEFGEDKNHNGWLDTPVMVSTRVARKH